VAWTLARPTPLEPPVKKPSIVALALAAVLLPSRAPARAAGPSQAFEEKNFRLTLPSDEWKFVEPADDDKQNGFVVYAKRVVSPGDEVDARVSVREAGGSDVESLLAQAKDVKEANYADVKSESPKAVEFAGTRGYSFWMTGKADNGSAVVFRVYGTVVGGALHMLDVRMSNGAGDKVGQEVDALVAGYRVLKGSAAGTPPTAPTAPPANGGDGTPPAPDGSGGGAAANGRTKEFKNFGLSWTLPEPKKAADPKPDEGGGDAKPAGPPPQWAWDRNDGNVDLPKEGNGMLARAGLVDGDQNPIIVEFFARPNDEKTNASVKRVVNSESLVEDITKKFFSDVPVPKQDEFVTLGNWHGGEVRLTGKSKEDPPKEFQFRFYAAILQKTYYTWQVHVRGSAMKTATSQLKELFAGLLWKDTTEGVLGPVGAPFPGSTETRGKGGGAESKVVNPAFTFTKPASFSALEFPATAKDFADWRWAGEARKPGAYVFVGILAFPVDSFTKAKPPREPESKIDDLENDWRNVVTDAATRPKSDKKNREWGDFAKIRAATYEFRGTAEQTPFLERGYLMKTGQTVLLVRVQYGGKDAEAALSKEVQALAKTFAPGK
jgi:hypothetical protein